MTTTIQKWGNSQGIRIPKFILESLNLSNNETVELIAENNVLIIKKAKQEEIMTIEKLFENYEDEYNPIDIDWGKPVGKEVW
jgi:antitoxin MazE